MTGYLRLCAGCNRDLSVHVLPNRIQDPTYCHGCEIRRMAGFAPVQGDRVRRRDYQSGPGSELLVLSDPNGEGCVKVKPLGLPSRFERVESVSDLVP